MEIKNFKEFQKLKFVRFGDLTPQDQNGFGNDSFHAAPAKKGFYAFLWPYYEKFLLGATKHPSNPSRKSAWIKDVTGNKIPVTDRYNFPPFIQKFIKEKGLKKSDILEMPLIDERSFMDDKPLFYAYMKKPHIFEYDGDIWHHLDVKEIKNDVLERVGSWVKTSMKTYKRAISHWFPDVNQYLDLPFEPGNKTFVNFHDRKIFNPYKKSGNNASRDSLEVFIEKI